MPFHHADPGTAESVWLASDRWDAVPALDVPAVAHRYARVLVVSAHPDDETLGVGGLVADLAQVGARLQVLVATDGVHALARSPTRAGGGQRWWTPYDAAYIAEVVAIPAIPGR